MELLQNLYCHRLWCLLVGVSCYMCQCQCPFICASGVSVRLLYVSGKSESGATVNVRRDLSDCAEFFSETKQSDFYKIVVMFVLITGTGHNSASWTFVLCVILKKRVPLQIKDPPLTVMMSVLISGCQRHLWLICNVVIWSNHNGCSSIAALSISTDRCNCFKLKLFQKNEERPFI